MQQRVIVSGDDALATTIIDELKRAGASVVKLIGPELAGTRVKAELARAGVAEAVAVICAGDDDATNLEIALLARKANPEIRVVSRLSNEVLREAVADDEGPSAIFGVAELAAPAVVEACLSRTTHPFEAAGIQFAVFGTEAPRGERCAKSTETSPQWRSCTARTHLRPVRSWCAQAAMKKSARATGRR